MIERKILYQRKRYGVFGCYHCHTYGISNLFQKTHICSFCGKTLTLKKEQIVFGSDDLGEATEYLKQLKAKSHPAGFIQANQLKVNYL